jgi:hypothetical protein
MRRLTIAKTVISQIETGMLSSKDQRRPRIVGAKRLCERRELDRFGPRTDD